MPTISVTPVSYVFLLSLNNSGTTIMSQYLASHIKDSYLPPFGNNEGQMAPNVRRIMRKNPWDPNYKFNWTSVKAEWDSLAYKDNKTTFIEASPPNIYRLSEILDTFTNPKIVFSISSPYSFIASCVFNYSFKNKVRRKQLTASEGRFIDNFDSFFADSIRRNTEQWIIRARKQRENIHSFGSKQFLVTYEDFCSSPTTLLEVLGIQQNNNFNEMTSLKGKSTSRLSKIIDMSAKHLSFLGIKGITAINNILNNDRDLLDYFGYKILSLDDCNSILSNDLLSSFDGQYRKYIFIEKHKSKRKKNSRMKPSL